METGQSQKPTALLANLTSHRFNPVVPSSNQTSITPPEQAFSAGRISILFKLSLRPPGRLRLSGKRHSLLPGSGQIPTTDSDYFLEVPAVVFQRLEFWSIYYFPPEAVSPLSIPSFLKEFLPRGGMPRD
jgi:hypothetical protein